MIPPELIDGLAVSCPLTDPIPASGLSLTPLNILWISLSDLLGVLLLDLLSWIMSDSGSTLYLWMLHILWIEILYDLSGTGHRSTNAITLTNDQKETGSWIALPHRACVHREGDNLKTSILRGCRCLLWLSEGPEAYLRGINPSSITLLITLGKLLEEPWL